MITKFRTTGKKYANAETENGREIGPLQTVSTRTTGVKDFPMLIRPVAK